jgi:hypothetical protein
MIASTTFDPALLNVSGAKMTHTGGTGIGLSYGPEKRPILLRTPFMVGFGINTWAAYGGAGATPQQSITLSFYGQPADEPFYHVLCAMDEWLLQTASQNTWEWLKSKNLSLEQLKSRHKRTVRPSSGFGGVPNIKFNLSRASTNSTAFFMEGAGGGVLEPDSLPQLFGKGTVAAAIVQCTGIWVKDGCFGFCWKLIHVMLAARPASSAAAAATKEQDSSTCMIED